MAIFWFLAGMLTTVAVLIALLPWLRALPGYGAVPSANWRATSIVAAMVVAAILGLYHWIGQPNAAALPTAMASMNSSNTAAGAFGSAAKMFSRAADASGDKAGMIASGTGPATKANAGSMDAAIASLESRLAKGGGSADDWELLAKSFDFLGRPVEAKMARARQLPALPPSANAAPIDSMSAPKPGAVAGAIAPVATSGVAVSGEVTLAAALNSKAAAGATLFIVAKSVESPGPPVAVFRGNVGSWPMKFTLDDSQSMLPGRNLSSAGRVTVEARISQKGQPIPAAGDLQGSTGVITPADRRPLKIVIDHIIP